MRVDIIERFCPGNSRVCSYVFSTDLSGHFDMLHVGLDSGKIILYPIPPVTPF
jgi:hypothetical protein